MSLTERCFLASLSANVGRLVSLFPSRPTTSVRMADEPKTKQESKS